MSDIRCGICFAEIDKVMYYPEYALTRRYVKNSGKLGYKFLTLCPTCNEKLNMAICFMTGKTNSSDNPIPEPPKSDNDYNFDSIKDD